MALHFLLEAYKHLKAITVASDAKPLLDLLDGGGCGVDRWFGCESVQGVFCRDCPASEFGIVSRAAKGDPGLIFWLFVGSVSRGKRALPHLKCIPNVGGRLPRCVIPPYAESAQPAPRCSSESSLNLQVIPRINPLHLLGQQRVQPRVILGARHLEADFTLVIHDIGSDGVQLMAQFFDIGEVQRYG